MKWLWILLIVMAGGMADYSSSEPVTPATQTPFVAAAGPAASDAAAFRDHGDRLQRTRALLNAGGQSFRIACFGDSITGIYYHSGGRCAWGDILAVGLGRAYPAAQIEIIQAGRSGSTTQDALERIRDSVLKRKPHLVVCMFGMNDVATVPAETYRGNLARMTRLCRAAGADVVLCTPTANDPDAVRPAEKLGQYAEIVRQVGTELRTPVADCHRVFATIRREDPRAWLMMMSDAIHPNMRGQKVIAEEVLAAIAGKRVPLADVPPPAPLIPKTLALLTGGQTLKVIAMPPYDDIARSCIRAVSGQAEVNMVTWPTAGKSLSEIQAWSLGIRPMQPNLVIIALPAAAAETEPAVFRRYTQIIQQAISYGRQAWDCIGVLPSVTRLTLSAEEKKTEQLGRDALNAMHIGIVAREQGAAPTAAAIFERWLRNQINEQAPEHRGAQP